jgi:hypothetical protein
MSNSFSFDFFIPPTPQLASLPQQARGSPQQVEEADDLVQIHQPADTVVITPFVCHGVRYNYNVGPSMLNDNKVKARDILFHVTEAIYNHSVESLYSDHKALLGLPNTYDEFLLVCGMSGLSGNHLIYTHCLAPFVDRPEKMWAMFTAYGFKQGDEAWEMARSKLDKGLF